LWVLSFIYHHSLFIQTKGVCARFQYGLFWFAKAAVSSDEIGHIRAQYGRHWKAAVKKAENATFFMVVYQKRKTMLCAFLYLCK